MWTQNLKIISFALALLAAFLAQRSHAATSEKALQIKTLNERMYRLIDGPTNRCPDKLGLTVNAQATEMRVYPMEMEWEKIRTHVNPVVTARAIRHSWEAPREEVIEIGKTKQAYSAELLDESLTAVTRITIEDAVPIESHAKMEFIQDRLNLTRWSQSNGGPIGENLLCVYKEHDLFKTAQSLAL